MRIRLIDTELSVCKVAGYDPSILDKPYCFIGSTPDERSLVCRTEDVPVDTLARDDGWIAFMIEGILDFSLIGILSSIAGVLASAGIGIFAISTYNTDYILVKEENRQKAIAALVDAGYEVIQEPSGKAD